MGAPRVSASRGPSGHPWRPREYLTSREAGSGVCRAVGPAAGAWNTVDIIYSRSRNDYFRNRENPCLQNYFIYINDMEGSFRDWHGVCLCYARLMRRPDDRGREVIDARTR